MATKTPAKTAEKTSKRALSEEQTLLKELTGKKFARDEARYLLTEISNHKWFISEKLKRDVGLKVAAIDYLENFANAEAN